MEIRWTTDEQQKVAQAIDSELLSDPWAALLEAQKVLSAARRRTRRVIDPTGYVKKLLKSVSRNSVAADVGKQTNGSTEPSTNGKPHRERHSLRDFYQPTCGDVVETVKKVRACADAVGGMKQLKALVDAII